MKEELKNIMAWLVDNRFMFEHHFNEDEHWNLVVKICDYDENRKWRKREYYFTFHRTKNKIQYVINIDDSHWWITINDIDDLKAFILKLRG